MKDYYCSEMKANGILESNCIFWTSEEEISSWRTEIIKRGFQFLVVLASNLVNYSACFQMPNSAVPADKSSAQCATP